MRVHLFVNTGWPPKRRCPSWRNGGASRTNCLCKVNSRNPPSTKWCAKGGFLCANKWNDSSRFSPHKLRPFPSSFFLLYYTPSTSTTRLPLFCTATSTFQTGIYGPLLGRTYSGKCQVTFTQVAALGASFGRGWGGRRESITFTMPLANVENMYIEVVS